MSEIKATEGKATACACNSTSSNNGDTGKKRIYLFLGLGLVLWVLLYCWIEPAAGFLIYDLLKLPQDNHLTSSLAFFLYEAPKVLLLLVIVVFAVGIVRSFFTAESTRRMLSGRREFAGNVMAAGLGIVTPFCSCSAVPLFIGFVETGIPLGVTFSFLIAAPMINEVALVMLFGMFGWRIALLYIFTGLCIAIFAGWVIGRLKLERYIEDWVFQIRMAGGEAVESNHAGFTWRLRYGIDDIREIVGKVWPFVLAGIAVGAIIHGYVPEGLMASFMGRDVWWAVPAAVLLGVPMYSNAAGIIPIMQALMEKGAALGTSLAFMMAVIGLSLPETIILRKVLKWQLIAVFIGVVAAGIVIIGYLFNAIL